MEFAINIFDEIKKNQVAYFIINNPFID